MDRYLYICGKLYFSQNIFNIQTGVWILYVGQFTRCFKSDDGKKKKTQQPFQCSTLDEHNWHANETQQEGFQPNIMQKHLSLIAEFRQALAHSPFLFFPSEVVLHIFCFLSVYDLANTSLVCRLFKVLVDRDDLWKLKCDSKDSFSSTLVFYLIIV
jgi:hypothetical protein